MVVLPAGDSALINLRLTVKKNLPLQLVTQRGDSEMLLPSPFHLHDYGSYCDPPQRYEAEQVAWEIEFPRVQSGPAIP